MAQSADERDEILRPRKDNKRLQTERDVLAKTTAGLAGASVDNCHAVFTLMRAANRGDAQGRSYAVHTLAKVLKVSCSGYYEWRDREPSARVVDNDLLNDRIVQIH